MLADQDAQPTLFADLKRIVGQALRLPERVATGPVGLQHTARKRRQGRREPE